MTEFERNTIGGKTLMLPGMCYTRVAHWNPNPAGMLYLGSFCETDTYDFLTTEGRLPTYHITSNAVGRSMFYGPSGNAYTEAAYLKFPDYLPAIPVKRYIEIQNNDRLRTALVEHLRLLLAFPTLNMLAHRPIPTILINI